MNGADLSSVMSESGGALVLVLRCYKFFQTFSLVGVVLDYDWHMSNHTVNYIQNNMDNAGVCINS